MAADKNKPPFSDKDKSSPLFQQINSVLNDIENIISHGTGKSKAEPTSPKSASDIKFELALTKMSTKVPSVLDADVTFTKDSIVKAMRFMYLNAGGTDVTFQAYWSQLSQSKPSLLQPTVKFENGNLKKALKHSFLQGERSVTPEPPSR